MDAACHITETQIRIGDRVFARPPHSAATLAGWIVIWQDRQPVLRWLFAHGWHPRWAVRRQCAGRGRWVIVQEGTITFTPRA